MCFFRSFLSFSALAAAVLQAQTPLDESPPQRESFTPAIAFRTENATALPENEEALPYPITFIHPDPKHAPPSLGLLGAPPDDPGRSTGSVRWREAHRAGEPVPGAIWSSVPLQLNFEADAATTTLPEPRFEISRADAERFALLARVLDQNHFEVGIRIDSRGYLEVSSGSDSSRHALLRDFLGWIRPSRGPHFEPATDRESGRRIALNGRFSWDLGMIPRAGVSWGTEAIQWETLSGKSAVLELIVLADGRGGASGAYAANPDSDAHPDLPKALATALALRFGEAAAWSAERWTLVTNPSSGTITRTIRQPLERVDPVMLYAPRPEYPRRLWRRGPEGFAYIRFVIDPEGSTRRIEVLETTEDAFGEAARETVAGWRFEPMQFDGEAISSEVIMTLPFRLPERWGR